MKPLLAVFLASAILTFAPSPGAGEEKSASIRIRVQTDDKAALRALRDEGLDITYARGNELEVLVTPAQLDDLRGRGLRVTVENADVYRPRDGQRGGGFLPEYVSYSEAVSELNDLAFTYPTLTVLTTIGTTHEGRSLYALKISDNAATDEDEPEVLVMGNHHAREVISVIIPLAVADSLLSNYGTDPQYTEWVDEREIWIVPVVNPDGLVYVENSDLFWRKNRRDNGDGSFGVDLNRNYEYEWGHDNNGSSPFSDNILYRGPSPASEPEVAAMEAFIDSREFVISLSYHSYGNLVLWSPAYKPGIAVDEDVLRGLGEAAAAGNGYEPGSAASGAIYIVNGGTDDWAYLAAGHSKIYAFTPEVGTFSDYFNPPAARIPTLVLEGSQPSWIAFEYADRPERLAPPGQPIFDELSPSSDGTADITWNAPVTADTEVVVYELVHQTGPSGVTDDLESGPDAFDLGGLEPVREPIVSGSFSLYSGSGNELNRICLSREGYEVEPGDEFTFRTWYDIESDWDYAYALLSTDGGRSFVNLDGTGTTMDDPHGLNADHGITGSSGGWQLHTYDLASWEGETVWLGFRYNTDGGVADEGIYVDDIFPVRAWASTEILSTSIVGTTYEVTGLEEGTHYFTVRGFDAEGEWGYPSDTAALVVEVSTEVSVPGALPAFSLSNHPNPFRGDTSIRFSLPRRGEHSLTVYDVAGRRVRSLSAGARDAGIHEVAWDGRDDGGRPLPSGVYFYALKSAAGELEERAVLAARTTGRSA